MFQYEEQKILQYAMQNGIIDLAGCVSRCRINEKTGNIRKISLLAGTDGRFYFKYKDKISGKKKISRHLNRRYKK